ncbi:hypothetical protein QBC44DRAFT_302580 [Cladorrhinum sp. PSN332]|nr:hypothetical protein QBC44DRAFT_302580 [Cladorrhinum sp. PSN332]
MYINTALVFAAAFILSAATALPLQESPRDLTVDQGNHPTGWRSKLGDGADKRRRDVTIDEVDHPRWWLSLSDDDGSAGKTRRDDGSVDKRRRRDVVDVFGEGNDGVTVTVDKYDRPLVWH